MGILSKYLCFYPFFSPRETRRFLHTIVKTIAELDVSARTIEAEKSKESINSITLAELFPGIENQLVCIIPKAYPDEGGFTLYELILLCAICRHINPQKIFEFGTFKGNTTLHLALNSPDTCEIFTLDLPPDVKEFTRYPVQIGPITDVLFTVGELYRGSTVESKIRQLYGDSASFDYSEFYSSIDLVLIDGNHYYQNVKSDSENAYRMLTSRGVIIWHDYTKLPEHVGVLKYLTELSKTMQLFKIRGTSFVIALPKSLGNHEF